MEEAFGGVIIGMVCKLKVEEWGDFRICVFSVRIKVPQQRVWSETILEKDKMDSEGQRGEGRGSCGVERCTIENVVILSGKGDGLWWKKRGV
jgi:hypothetical protein